jgi:hypothetical protein
VDAIDLDLTLLPNSISGSRRFATVLAGITFAH